MRRRDSRIPRTLQIAAAFEGEKIGHIAGDIVRFRGDGSPLRALTLSIDPVQDLHGYDSPWPAGGGKNLFAPYTERSSNAGIDYTVNQDGSINCKGTATSASYSGTNSHYDNAPLVIKAGTYTVSANGFSATGGAQGYLSFGARYSDDTLIQFTAIRNSSYTITLEQDAHCFYWIYVQNGRTIDENIYIQIETGTTQTSWTPYSNLCPISGHTGGNVWRTGRNLLELDSSEMVSSGWNRRFPITVKAGTYIISCQNQFGASTKGAAVALLDENYNDVANLSNYEFGNTSFAGTKRELTDSQAEKIKFIVFRCRAAGATFEDIAAGNLQLELSSTPTPYTPYTGTTIPVTWSEAGTVYGGVWDVLNGVLKKTWGMAILANRTWTMETTANGNVFSCNLLPDKAKSYNQMCSKYKAVNNYRNYLKNGEMGTYNATNGRNRVSICDNAYSTVSDFVNGLAGVDYIYELATPLTYTLTPQQLDTLAGQNVVWGDAGAVELEYVCDNGVEGGKLALLLRNKPELLIAMRKGAPTQELLLAMGGRGDAKPSITPLKPLEEKKDEDEEAMRK